MSTYTGRFMKTRQFHIDTWCDTSRIVIIVRLVVLPTPCVYTQEFILCNPKEARERKTYFDAVMSSNYTTILLILCVRLYNNYVVSSGIYSCTYTTINSALSSLLQEYVFFFFYLNLILVDLCTESGIGSMYFRVLYVNSS